MTNFGSEETRRHDGMAEVEGSKWFTRTMTIPSAPPSFAKKGTHQIRSVHDQKFMTRNQWNGSITVGIIRFDFREADEG
jgi:hypothetical protein